MRKRITLALVTLSAAVGTTAAVWAQSGDQPESIGTDIDQSAVVDYAPGETVPVVDSNGDLLRCDDGELLQVAPEAAIPPGVADLEPVDPPAGSTESGELEGEVIVTDPAVPRCGPSGGGADADPVWVPESVGDDQTTAPQRYVRQQR